MFTRSMDRNRGASTDTEVVKGPSLARGPAWIVGLVLAAFGLAMFFRSPGTPLSTSGFPDASPIGGTFLGIETNAWTAWGTTAAGILVLIGAAQHAMAKTMSLITGLALGVAAIIAIIDGDVLGLAAANTWTMVGWGAASIVLLVTALLPRARRTREVDTYATDAPSERVIERDRTVAGPAPVARQADAPMAATPEQPAEPAMAPGGVQSDPLRRTYREPARTSAEADADAAEPVEPEKHSRLLSWRR